MSRRLLYVGLCVLASVWFVPWSQLGPGEFSSHMIVHMGVVGLAAPMIALGVAGGRLDPVRRRPALFPPIPLSVVELLVVWAWHAPALHHGARHSMLSWWIEQGSFLVSGLMVWLSAFGGDVRDRSNRRAEGLVALLLTFLHMTLLGALLALAPRPLYGGHDLDDQQLGGAIMLLAGSVAYLAGGLWLAIDLLRTRRGEASKASTEP